MRPGSSSLHIGEKRIGEDAPTYVVAEMACAHEGELSIALRLVDLAANAKVDAIQLQMFRAARLVSPSSSGYEAAREYELNPDEWREVIRYVHDRDLDTWANVFDTEMLAIALDAGVDALKLHSSDVSNAGLVPAVAETGMPVSLAVGGTTENEIAATLSEFEGAGSPDLILMHGFQAFPTNPVDVRLGRLRALSRRFGHLVGFQDHTKGGDPLAMTLPLVSIGFGAAVLEKHITVDRSAGGTDSISALESDELACFVRSVRRIDAALKHSDLNAFSESEKEYRKRMKRTVVCRYDLDAGETLEVDKIDFMRADAGFLASQVDHVVGRRLRRGLKRHQPIEEADLL